jgi:RimJ/RimL family protein N-acetyltransferase
MSTSGHDYRIMPRSRLSEGDLELRAIGPQDIEAIRQWRNAQMDVLRQSSVITPEAQQRYFSEHVWPDKEVMTPRQILLAIEQHGRLIGYGGLVHISWHDQRAEVSFLLEPELEADPQAQVVVFSRFLKLVLELAFVDLSLSRMWTETYAHRAEHLRTLEAVGFRLEGRMRAHVIVNGTPTDSLLHGLLANEWNEH